MFQIRETVGCLFLKIDVLKSFANFTWKILCWSIFLIKLLKRSANVLKRDSSTSLLMWNLRIFKNSFYKTPLVGASEIKNVFNSQRFLLRLAFCLKHVALLIIHISFSSSGDWKEIIRQQNVSFARLKFAEWRSALTGDNVLNCYCFPKLSHWWTVIQWHSRMFKKRTKEAKNCKRNNSNLWKILDKYFWRRSFIANFLVFRLQLYFKKWKISVKKLILVRLHS